MFRELVAWKNVGRSSSCGFCAFLVGGCATRAERTAPFEKVGFGMPGRASARAPEARLLARWGARPAPTRNSGGSTETDGNREQYVDRQRPSRTLSFKRRSRHTHAFHLERAALGRRATSLGRRRRGAGSSRARRGTRVAGRQSGAHPDGVAF